MGSMAENAGDHRFFDDVLRSSLEHYNGLIAHRLSWFMASQSFLFTAYAIALNGPPAAAKLLTIMPVVGIVTAVAIYVGILAALGTRSIVKAALPPLLTPMRIRI